jgi:TorA maturation chaperone TorD
MKNSAAANRALARALLYKLLSRLFDYPRLDLPTEIQTDVLLAASACGVEKPIRILLREWSRCADREREYVAALGHVTKDAAPAYETSYGVTHTFQQTAELSDIAAFYRAHGLQAAGDERLDHISPELEFMAILALKEANNPDRASESREAEKQFFEEHLGRWAPLFAEKLKAGRGRRDCYGLAARALEFFMAAEQKELNARPAPVRAVDVTPARFGPEGACFSCSLGEDQEKIRPKEMV